MTLRTARAPGGEEAYGPGGSIAALLLALLGAVLTTRMRRRTDTAAWQRLQWYFGGVTALFLVLGTLNVFVPVPPTGHGIWRLKIGDGALGFAIMIAHFWSAACTSYCGILQRHADAPEVFD